MSAFRKSSVHTYEINTDIKEGFPLLIDDMTLAHHLGIRNKTLQYVLSKRNDESAYHCFGIPEFKKDKTFKKVRHIQTPVKFPQLCFIHDKLNEWFGDISLPDSITAYRKGYNVLLDVQQHIRKSYHFIDDETSPMDQDFIQGLRGDPRYKVVTRYKEKHNSASPRGDFFYQPFVALQIDIKDFFNSIRSSWIRSYFHHEVGYPHHMALQLARLCTVKQSFNNKKGEKIEKRFLPQGSPLSGSLANLISHDRFVKKVQDYLATESSDWVFTVYSDDLFLTHPDQTITKERILKVQARVIQILNEAGFAINHRKVKIKHSKYERILRLGVVINEQANIRKSEVKNIKETLLMIAEQGWNEDCHNQDPVQIRKRIEILKGKIEWVRQIKPETGEYLKELLVKALDALQKVPDLPVFDSRVNELNILM